MKIRVASERFYFINNVYQIRLKFTCRNDRMKSESKMENINIRMVKITIC